MKNASYKTACTNGLPDDEQTCRRHKELNLNINLEKFAFC
jgi:hypothetical protein